MRRDLNQGSRISSGRLALLGAMMIVLGVVLCGIWGYLILASPRLPVAPTPTWTILTSTSIPVTETPVITATQSSASTTPEPSGTGTALPTAAPGTLAVGARVQVSGTGGGGLSLRSQPSTTAPRVAIALEGEQLRITDGPRQVENFTWWKLRRADGTEGWGVQTFIQPVTH